MGTVMEQTRFVGMDFSNPEVDLQKVAEGLGARTVEIAHSEMIAETLGNAFDYCGPSFITVRREP